MSEGWRERRKSVRREKGREGGRRGREEGREGERGGREEGGGR